MHNSQKPYEPVLEKLARTLVTVEKESEYLFQMDTKVVRTVVLHLLLHERLSQLGVCPLLKAVYEGLRGNTKIAHPINEWNIFTIRLFRSPSIESTTIRDADVPVMFFQVYASQNV
jgi:hypothetical protein